MLESCGYYTGITLNAFATYYAHNYAGIIGSSLAYAMHMLYITLGKVCSLQMHMVGWKISLHNS